MDTDGSSPRVRGTRFRRLRRRGEGRFIPACAGNSARRSGRIPVQTVHPRVCGELRPNHLRRADAGRFIPACAGNSMPTYCYRRNTPVHPRVCGELVSGAIGRSFDNGSSPRVRGTQQDTGIRSVKHRFIPACAGNSHDSANSVPLMPVHPRVCGELIFLAGLDFFGGGSSPRVRGTRQPVACHVQKLRFIPACAGNSMAGDVQVPHFAVHPRVCGELVARWPTSAGAAGSSPRVRGTQLRGAGQRPPSRFIPACAGNSLLIST